MQNLLLFLLIVVIYSQTKYETSYSLITLPEKSDYMMQYVDAVDWMNNRKPQ